MANWRAIFIEYERTFVGSVRTLLQRTARPAREERIKQLPRSMEY
jgi:hypothetical protein